MSYQQKGHVVSVPNQDQIAAPIIDLEPSESTKEKQGRIVLNALRQGPKSTLDLRALHVMNCAARVLELRRVGVRIETLRKGRCAVYILHERVQP
jgi:hypothetical protein